MHRALIVCATLFGTTALSAQSVALDVTKTDCEGVLHPLYAELEEGRVIVQEYAMVTGCAGCWQAAEAIMSVVDAFEASHPGRVEFYATGYDDVYTCPQMNTWQSAHSLTPVLFTNGAAEVDYYGGMGMPTVVVLGGGAAHGVYAKWIGFGAWLIEDLTDSIQIALDATIGIRENTSPTISLFPSPAGDVVNISLEGPDRIAQVQLLDLAGRLVAQSGQLDMPTALMDTADLPSGMYVAHIITRSGAVLRSPFQVGR